MMADDTGDNSGDNTKEKTEGQVSYSAVSLRDAEERLGLRLEGIEVVGLDRMLQPTTSER